MKTTDIAQNPKEKFRDIVKKTQDFITAIPGSVQGEALDKLCPLKHSFSPGLYIREIFIPSGTVMVGKIHKHEHPNFLIEGEVCVITELNGKQDLTAPMSMISPAGTKRTLYAKTNVRWITVHLNPTNTRDLIELENEIIAPSFEEYDEFKKIEAPESLKEIA